MSLAGSCGLLARNGDYIRCMYQVSALTLDRLLRILGEVQLKAGFRCINGGTLLTFPPTLHTSNSATEVKQVSEHQQTWLGTIVNMIRQQSAICEEVKPRRVSDDPYMQDLPSGSTEARRSPSYWRANTVSLTGTRDKRQHRCAFLRTNVYSGNLLFRLYHLRRGGS